jgi:hypothetical protein
LICSEEFCNVVFLLLQARQEGLMHFFIHNRCT